MRILTNSNSLIRLARKSPFDLGRYAAIHLKSRLSPGLNRRENREAWELFNLCDSATKSIFSRGRLIPEEPDPDRTCFQHDKDRIHYSKAYRRLRDKAQVIIAPTKISGIIHSRGPHTDEVALLARNISLCLRLNEDLAEAIGSGHDLGHSPFGHRGEAELNKLSIKYLNGLLFMHNIQSLRVVDDLERLNLTYEVRHGIVSHLGESTKSKFSWEENNNDDIFLNHFKNIKTKMKIIQHTPEGAVVELADRIAYIPMDIGDAIAENIFTAQDLPRSAARVLGTTTREIVKVILNSVYESSFDHARKDVSVIRLDQEISNALNEYYHFLYERYYLTDYPTKALDYPISTYMNEIFDYYISTSDNPQKRKLTPKEAIDQIANMTDTEAINEFERITGENSKGKKYSAIISKATDSLLYIDKENLETSIKWTREILKVVRQFIDDLDLELVNCYKFSNESKKLVSLQKSDRLGPSRYYPQKADIKHGEKRYLINQTTSPFCHIENRLHLPEEMSEEDKKQAEVDFERELETNFGPDYRNIYKDRIEDLENALRENLYFRINLPDYSFILLVNKHFQNVNLVKNGLKPQPLFKTETQKQRFIEAFNNFGERIKNEFRQVDNLREKELEEERLKCLIDLARQLEQTKDLSMLYKQLLTILPNMFKRGETSIEARSRSILLFDPQEDALIAEDSIGLKYPKTKRIKGGVAWTVYGSGQPAMKLKDEKGSGSFMCVPIKTSGNEILGVLTIRSKQDFVFYPKDLEYFEAIAGILGDKLKVNKISNTDGLTGLYNHSAGSEKLLAVLENAEKTSQPVSLMVADLDFFKSVNDTHGHAAGDMLLQELGQIIQRLTGNYKIISNDNFAIRWGGEEFVLVLPGINKTLAIQIAEELRESVEKHPFNIGDKTIQKTISLGVAAFPVDGKELFKKADAALYQSKNNGRNRVTPA